MGIVNSFKFTRTVFECDKFLNATHNQYRVASVRPYTDKKGVLPDGYNLTLTILKDDYDYGLDKNGNPRENNVYQNFDVTVLNRNHDIRKGDFVKLLDFDDEHSFVLGFDLILRFRDYEVLQPKGAK